MKKLTVFDFCSQIGAASDEIPVVVRVGLQEIGHFRSLYQIPAVAMPGILEAKVTFVTVKMYANYHPSEDEGLQHNHLKTERRRFLCFMFWISILTGSLPVRP